jgi:threonine aldolase
LNYTDRNFFSQNRIIGFHPLALSIFQATEKAKYKMIDLRSDTITKPTQEMLAALCAAEVGDDVFGEDPTVNSFQQKVAAMFGMEAGLFVPSGTMSNQLALKVLTEPGDELLIDEKGHICNYESAAGAFLSGVQMQTLEGKSGKLTPGVLENRKRGTFDWEPNTRVICIENTTNKGGGVCYTRNELTEIKQFADQHALYVHLDGARIWNAITQTGIEPKFFGTIANTITVCFSKGLGAPVGSMLLSTKDHCAKARRFRKMWGGGMRQIGLLAAAADFALENNWPLLAADHVRARKFAGVVSQCSKLSIDIETVETNIVIFEVTGESALAALGRLKQQGILMVPFGSNTIRATFHYQIDDEKLEHVNGMMKELFG